MDTNQTPKRKRKSSGSTNPIKKKQRVEKEAEEETLKYEDSSSFSFEEDSESHSSSGSHMTSTDLSSTVEQGSSDSVDVKEKLVLDVDPKMKKKMMKRVQKEGTDIMNLKAKDKGIVYLGHIPFGFFEDQMKEFFSQFGTVTRLRLSRNKKSGRSRHYAFVEFVDPVVAQIVADTMDGYMMFNKTLKCNVVPEEKYHPKMFHGQGRRYIKPDANRKKFIEAYNKEKSSETLKKRQATKIEQKKKRLESLGIDYDLPTEFKLPANPK
eukprot:TRINITY_DN8736_c0_g1_i1.p1 TRINITY_DN8736_c0_g1~~TRINITY_DN8736_c0_g1_i1.p1  ORF type:complete len:288 (+),score=83.68 TRINITY_DN8736_c0_g1_i1:68-865(+)